MIDDFKTMVYDSKMPPCKDCPDMCAGCHSTCEKYLTWEKGHQKRRAQFHESITLAYIAVKR